MNAPSRAPALLEVCNLTIRFGGITALDDLSFAVAPGHISGLIGPNGAGKTTAFNCITRLYRPASGAIRFKGQDLSRLAPHEVARKRIARTFQNVALFDRMSALDNVLVGYSSRLRGLARPADERRARDAARRALEYLGLGALEGRAVAGLPFGTRKMLELARALVSEPELLLLDEPASGLSAEEVARLALTLKGIVREFGTTILMVEHHMRLVMETSDHVVVLASGRKIGDGEPAAVRNEPAVIEAYLGQPPGE